MCACDGAGSGGGCAFRFQWRFVFFKQKTAYELLMSLVGSERCIRDRCQGTEVRGCCSGTDHMAFERLRAAHYWICLLYTSDAADDLPCVDFGGRRFIKKKNKKKQTQNSPEVTPSPG